MKFIFFSAQYLPTVGGLERYTNSLAKQLIALGHSVLIVTSCLDGLASEEIDENGIQIYRLPVKWFMNKRFPVIIPNALFRELKSKIKDEKPDFAVIQTRFYINSIFGARFCKRYNIPFIVVEHGSAHLINGGIFGFLGNVYEHLVFAIIKHYTSNIYAVSKISGEWLEHFNAKTDKLLYNGVDPQALFQLAQGANTDFITSHLHCENPQIICFVGRLVPEKGVIPLAKAFQSVLKDFPNTYLFMAGDGELFKELQNLNLQNLVLTGNLSYPESLALIQRSDIFCLPTFSEGFSTSVLEAAALKTLIITTPTGGSPEIILTHDHGILLNSMEQEDIKTSLSIALSCEDFRKRATENAYKVLEENFTWDRIAHHLLEIANKTK